MSDRFVAAAIISCHLTGLFVGVCGRAIDQPIPSHKPGAVTSNIPGRNSGVGTGICE
ncbi:MAG TPA: hypothetical protein VFJ58_17050 [Armatimonadota bacterium]|nr:hypothetical protein [Armatimonadota bacterium]